MLMQHSETIAAIATASSHSSIGVIRVSGQHSHVIAKQLGITELKPRQVVYARFCDAQGQVIDDGIAIWFRAPHSFTGEDVLELQGHGNPLVLRQLLDRCLTLGARMARPGEFSERAFLNGKFDLAQAEAIADLITASDLRAVRAARRSLDGVFSQQCQTLAHQLLQLRVQIESSIDFSDEPLETLEGEQVQSHLGDLERQLQTLVQRAHQGQRLRDGFQVVLLGPPNVGKSALLNRFTERDRAIVSDIAGTTRDTLHETVHLDGLELTLVDTAGLRSSVDPLEQEGIRRTQRAVAQADLVLAILDAQQPLNGQKIVTETIDQVAQVLWVYNKIDLLRRRPVLQEDTIAVSALTGEGVDALRQRLQRILATDMGHPSDGEFSARMRHVQSLQRAQDHLQKSRRCLAQQTIELVAEELRLAHQALGEITGEVTSDDLLGQIFATFCLGK